MRGRKSHVGLEFLFYLFFEILNWGSDNDSSEGVPNKGNSVKTVNWVEIVLNKKVDLVCKIEAKIFDVCICVFFIWTGVEKNSSWEKHWNVVSEKSQIFWVSLKTMHKNNQMRICLILPCQFTYFYLPFLFLFIIKYFVFHVNFFKQYRMLLRWRKHSSFLNWKGWQILVIIWLSNLSRMFAM